MLTLRISEGGPEGTSVGVDGADPLFDDADIQYTFEQAAARGDTVAARACALVGAHWIDMCGWTYDAQGRRVHGAGRCYVDR